MLRTQKKVFLYHQITPLEKYENKKENLIAPRIKLNANDKNYKILKDKLSKEFQSVSRFENNVQTNFENKHNLFLRCLRDLLKKKTNKRLKCIFYRKIYYNFSRH